ncbi:MAG: hypothetical protein ACREU8_05435 [Gammaproteobacteria bacterium]
MWLDFLSTAGLLTPSGNRIGMMCAFYPSHHPTKVDLNAEVGPGDIITFESFF